MTGLVRRSGWSIRLVRTGLEVVVVAIGFALGGVVGIGTILYTLSIGPLVQLMLPRVHRRAARSACLALGGDDRGAVRGDHDLDGREAVVGPATARASEVDATAVHPAARTRTV